MSTYYFLYRKDNNTAFDLGKGYFATNFGYEVTDKNGTLQFTDKNTLLSLVTISLHYRNDFTPSGCLLIRDRLLDFLKEAAKKNVIFIRDEALGDLLERNIYEITTHNIYYEDKDLKPYINIKNLNDYFKDPLNFYIVNNITKGNNL